MEKFGLRSKAYVEQIVFVGSAKGRPGERTQSQPWQNGGTQIPKMTLGFGVGRGPFKCKGLGSRVLSLRVNPEASFSGVTEGFQDLTWGLLLKIRVSPEHLL